MRRWTKRLKAHTLLDNIAAVCPREFIRPREGFHKFKKDDFYWDSVREYLHEKYVSHLINRRKGRYQPSHIVRNFWKS